MCYVLSAVSHMANLSTQHTALNTLHMLLTIDIGNTNIVFAVFRNAESAEDSLLGWWRVETDINRNAGEYAEIFNESTKNITAPPTLSDISAVIISCVVPDCLPELKIFSEKYCNHTAFVIGENKLSHENLGIRIDLDNPAEVGADRLVNAIAAYDKYKSAAIIIDFGTATTFDIINNKGDYLGGLIAPGINLSVKTLHNATAKLPEIDIVKPPQIIGKSTVTAMQSGMYYGYKGLIEGIVAQVRKEHSDDMKVIATGGLAKVFADATDIIGYTEPNLTINGLHKIYKTTL